MSRAEGRRVPSLVVLALAIGGVVAAGTLVEREGTEPGATTASGAPVRTPADVAPLAPPSNATGSTWFCAGGTAVPDGIADHEVVIANPGDADLTATLTVYPGAPSSDPAARAAIDAIEPVVEVRDVPARSRVEVLLQDVLTAPFASALVEIEGGDVVVEHVVRGEDDLDAAPCATEAATEWHVAAGQTVLGSQELLVLFNPFPDDAVVDIRFTTPEGVRTPTEFDGFVVPARRTLAIDVGLVVSRHAQVSSSLSVRSGRLVVDRIERFTSEPPGLGLTPAAAEPAELWYFPEGIVTDDIGEVVTVYNPGEATAEVDVELILAPSDDPTAVTGVEPFQLTVPPGGYAQVDVGAEDRVPQGSGHALVVRSQNTVPVVAERWQRSGAGRVGFGATLGSPVAATRWLLAAGGTPSDASQAEYLVLVNPSLATIARVTITAPTPSQQLVPTGLQDIEVAPGGRIVVELGSAINRDDLPLVVTSTEPVVVERGLYVTAGGFAQSIAVAQAGTASIPAVDATPQAPVVVTTPPTSTDVTAN